jgi:glyoxalase family protein
MLSPTTSFVELSGIHHLTAISAAIRENYRFYTQTLGMRLVKRTVNQDDVSAYHLFYADAKGSPGTDLTFFNWRSPQERRGTRSIVRTSLRVNGQKALTWWSGHFDETGVRHSDIFEHDRRLTLTFEDSEGQRLALLDDKGQGISRHRGTRV